jgi:hypothetical protein
MKSMNTTSAQEWFARKFEFLSTHKLDFAIGIINSLKEGWRVFSRLKNMSSIHHNQQLPKVETWGIYSPLSKLAVF